MKRIMPTLLMCTCFMIGTTALADTCESIIPGASMDAYEGRDGAYDADGNCHSRTTLNESDCKRRTGTLFDYFSPDHGKGFTHCIFRPPSTNEPEEAIVPPSPEPEPPKKTDTQPPMPTEQPPSVDTTSPRYMLRLCNRSQHGTIYAAIAVYDDPSDEHYTIHAWWTITQGACVDTVMRNFGDYGSHEIGIHGHTASGWVYPDPAKAAANFCLNDKRYVRYGTPGYKCVTGETLRPFFKRTVTRKDPDYTLNMFTFW